MVHWNGYVYARYSEPILFIIYRFQMERTRDILLRVPRRRRRNSVFDCHSINTIYLFSLIQYSLLGYIILVLFQYLCNKFGPLEPSVGQGQVEVVL